MSERNILSPVTVLDRIGRYLGTSVDAQIAKKLSVSRTTVSSWTERIPDKKLLELAAKYGWDYEYLKTGKEAPPKESDQSKARLALNELSAILMEIDEEILGGNDVMQLQRIMLKARRAISRWQQELDVK